jgi:hypothetical protein
MRDFSLAARALLALIIVVARCCREYASKLFAGGVPAVPPPGSVFFPLRSDLMGIRTQEELAEIFSSRGRKCYFVRRRPDRTETGGAGTRIAQEAFFQWFDLIAGSRVWWALAMRDGKAHVSSDVLGRLDSVIKCSLIRALRRSEVTQEMLLQPLSLWICVAAQRSLRIATWAASADRSVVVCTDPGYVNEYEFCTVFTGARRTVLIVNHGFDEKHLFLRKAVGEECFEHPLHLTNEDMASCGDFADSARIRQELVARYYSKNWYNYVGTVESIVCQSPSFARLKEKLATSTGDIVVVFPHIFWDGTFFLGHNCFDGYQAWFEWLCAYIATDENRRTWVIKLHPANLGKGESQDKAQELEVICRHGLDARDNIIMLPYDSEISALDLFTVADVVLTVRGTVALEAALFGVPALCAGSGRHSLPGLVMESLDAADLRDNLDHARYRQFKPDQDLAAQIFDCYFAHKDVPYTSLLNEGGRTARDFDHFLASGSRHFMDERESVNVVS